MVRTELPRGAGHDPCGAQARARRGSPLVPVHGRGDGLRHRQLRRDDGRRRRGAGVTRRRGPRRDPEGAHSRRLRRRRPRRLHRVGRAAGRPTRHRTRDTRRSVGGGRGDDLHVGHDRQAEGRAAHANRPRARLRAPRRAQLAARAVRAPHDRAALPLRTARVRVAVAHARRTHRRAAQVRRAAVDRAREGAPRHEHLLGADPAETDRVAARGEARDRRTCPRWSRSSRTRRRCRTR